MKKICLIEDDKALSQGICLALKSDEIEVVPCYNLKTVGTLLNSTAFDLLILDINLPDGNGLDFLTRFKLTYSTPVIILTANDMETDIVAGLEMGADDYMTKPFSLAVLRARVNTQLRKAAFPAPSADLKAGAFSSRPLCIDAYSFDFDRMEYRKHHQIISLSNTEQRLLKLLVLNRGITLSRSDLIDKIWTDGSEYVDENALSVTVKRLRDKLEDDPSKPQYIKTVYGIGYTWRNS